MLRLKSLNALAPLHKADTEPGKILLSDAPPEFDQSQLEFRCNVATGVWSYHSSPKKSSPTVRARAARPIGYAHPAPAGDPPTHMRPMRVTDGTDPFDLSNIA